MNLLIPCTIREADKPSLESLLLNLDVPFLDVNVPTIDNPLGYTEIVVDVKPKKVKVWNQQAPPSNDATQIGRLAAQSGMDAIFERTGAVEYIPVMEATQHLFSVLPKLADRGTYIPHVQRNGRFSYASGRVELKISGTAFRVKYTEDALNLVGKPVIII